ISLPVGHAEQVVVPEDSEVEAYSEPVASQLLTGVRIYVVDDDPDSCDLLKFAFALRGAVVKTSSSALEAFESITQDPPDILLADINMPDEDGYSLIRRIRESLLHNGITFPAIALTAMARAEDSERALAAGFHVHVPKPVEIDELTATIAELLN